MKRNKKNADRFLSRDVSRRISEQLVVSCNSRSLKSSIRKKNSKSSRIEAEWFKSRKSAPPTPLNALATNSAANPRFLESRVILSVPFCGQ